MLVGDTGDKTNSIITLCTSQLLLKSQGDLYILTLNKASGKAKIKRVTDKAPVIGAQWGDSQVEPESPVHWPLLLKMSFIATP